MSDEDGDLADPFRPNGPYAIAKTCEESIARLEAERETAAQAERRTINRRIHQLRQMLAWCKSRRGYVEPTA